MKVKFDGYRYLAYQDHDNRWIPFWNNHQGRAALELGKEHGNVEPDKEYELIDVYISNCGGPKTCSGLWPNPDCPNCGGLGVGAQFI